jgi:hypothetical protein
VRRPDLRSSASRRRHARPARFWRTSATCSIGHARWLSAPLPWDQEVARFFASLAQFDAVLAGDAPLDCTAEKLFQAPIADALTHIGQLAMLRRLAGSPVRGEDFSSADIVPGRVGPSQAAPRFEFD